MNSMDQCKIGVVGGVGPYAGLDLVKKIFDNTIASRDCDHLSVALLSFPGDIPDRSDYLFGTACKNPGQSVLNIIKKLEALGSKTIGVSCNTSHAEEIFAIPLEYARKRKNIKLVNMVDEVSAYIAEYYSGWSIGVMGTSGTIRSGVYHRSISRMSNQVVDLPVELQNQLHDAIYNEAYGIKANSVEITQVAEDVYMRCIEVLKKNGAEAIILGCTELPLVARTCADSGIPLIDSTHVLARALIRESAPSKLKPHQPFFK